MSEFTHSLFLKNLSKIAVMREHKIGSRLKPNARVVDFKE